MIGTAAIIYHYYYRECCENCACYEKEQEYCFRYGNHAPKDGKCDSFKPKGG